ncbi:hypothetical protein [Archangium violaceum]|uniref:hypothetical protein n=1 Tax=Archangium violaceum TaxID=83451 RepID=UPI0036DB1CAB
MPNPNLQVVLAALNAQTPDKHHPSVDVVDVSKLDVPLIIEQLPILSPSGAIRSLLKNSAPLDKDALDKESTYALSGKPGFKKLQNWASGGAPFHRFVDKDVTLFFDTLFEAVLDVVNSRLDGDEQPWALSRNDLFHGHLSWAYFSSLSDVVMVFHAQEYPADLESFKSKAAGELEADVKPFLADAAPFGRRCPIWSMRKKRIWSIDFFAKNNPFLPLLSTPLSKAGRGVNPLVVDQDNIGGCLADISYFPREKVHSFMRIWSHKMTDEDRSGLD